MVVLAPLPFASVVPWAQALMALALGLALILWALAAARGASFGGRDSLWYVLPFAAAMGWALAQASPLTPAAWHHPLWVEAGAALGARLDGSIALDPDATVDAVLRALSAAAAFWLALQLGRDPARARRLFWAVALAGGGYAVYGLALHLSGVHQVLWLDKRAYQASVTASFINANAYAAYSGLCLVTGLALLAQASQRLVPSGVGWRAGIVYVADNLRADFFVLAIVCATLGTALLLTLSRGGLLSTAIGAIVLFGALWASPGGREHGMAWFAGLTAIGAVALVGVSGELTLGRLAATIGGGPTGREDIHALAWRAIAEAPFLGGGYGMFEELFFLGRDASFPWRSAPYDKAHSPYLELVMELGLPAAALLAVALLVIAARCLGGIARRRRGALYPAVGLAVLALIGVQSLVDFAVQIPAVAVTFFALLGVACAQSRGRAKGQDSVR